LAEKRKKSKSHVWCFVGDMTSETGCFHENLKYSITHDLPITWVIEDNFKSVCTDTRETWRLKFLTHENYLKSDKIIYYKYQSKYPHAGAGKRVQF
jgi:TPP-dependent pyruvate/acetoin dehydrogenase alpha subunit